MFCLSEDEWEITFIIWLIASMARLMALVINSNHFPFSLFSIFKLRDNWINFCRKINYLNWFTNCLSFHFSVLFVIFVFILLNIFHPKELKNKKFITNGFLESKVIMSLKKWIIFSQWLKTWNKISFHLNKVLSVLRKK